VGREILEIAIILVSWILLISNLGQVLRMFKDHKIVKLLKIPTVFITTIILTAPEMVIATIDKVAWVANKRKLLYLDRIVLSVLIMTSITWWNNKTIYNNTSINKIKWEWVIIVWGEIPFTLVIINFKNKVESSITNQWVEDKNRYMADLLNKCISK